MPRSRLSSLPKLAGRAAGKVSSPTSYTATGTAQIPPPQLDTESGSSQPVIIREIVPELASAFARLQTYTKMMNDMGVDVSMRAAKMPVLGAEFYIDAYDDTPESEIIREFIDANLFGGMSAPFVNSLEDILHMFEDGYAMLEKVWEERTWSSSGSGANTKKYTMLKKLSVRPANTIKEIIYDDNGGPQTITQTAIRSGGKSSDAPLDVNKVMIFTFGRKGGDLTGRSLLRTAYSHWYYKTHFYKIDAIQKERHGIGVPRGKLLPGYNREDKSILRQILRNLRTNEESFVLQTPNVEIDFIELNSNNMVDVLASANHHNIMILMNVMAQFLALGVEGSGGGRATGGAQTDIFMKSLKYVANQICDVHNMYLIPELVVWNFPTNNFPKLCVRSIGDTRDLQMLGSALGNLLHEGGITMDAPTENWFRRVFDMPQKIGATDAIYAPKLPANTTPVVPSSSNGNTGDKNSSKSSGGQPGKPVNAPQ